MTFKQITLAILLFYKITLFCGFSADTLVKIPNGYIPIRQLVIGDSVICHNSNNECVEQKITYTKKNSVKNCLALITHNATFITSPDQKFYIPDKQIWQKAEHLAPGDVLLGKYDSLIPINSIIPIHEKLDLYDITVETDHNFLITDSDILVHNIFPVAIGFSFAFGSGAIEFIGATIGITTVIGVVGAAINRLRNKDGAPSHKISFNLGGPSGFNGNNDDDNKKRRKQRPLSNKEARAQAKKMGFTEIRGLSRSRPNELTFKRDSTIISPDRDCHKGGVWKMLDRHGERISTWNIDLTKMIGT